MNFSPWPVLRALADGALQDELGRRARGVRDREVVVVPAPATS
ncbi:MAG TPA: hypothetical protein VFK02_05175 [Kofleriaceae bacterium]|nr:hypothetical protein [Kofleriaceae bacterium]